MKWLVGIGIIMGAIYFLPWYVLLPIIVVMVFVVARFGKDNRSSGYDVPGGSASIIEEGARSYSGDFSDYKEELKMNKPPKPVFDNSSKLKEWDDLVDDLQSQIDKQLEAYLSKKGYTVAPTAQNPLIITLSAGSTWYESGYNDMPGPRQGLGEYILSELKKRYAEVGWNVIYYLNETNSTNTTDTYDECRTVTTYNYYHVFRFSVK